MIAIDLEPILPLQEIGQAGACPHNGIRLLLDYRPVALVTLEHTATTYQQLLMGINVLLSLFHLSEHH